MIYLKFLLVFQCVLCGAKLFSKVICICFLLGLLIFCKGFVLSFPHRICVFFLGALYFFGIVVSL